MLVVRLSTAYSLLAKLIFFFHSLSLCHSVTLLLPSSCTVSLLPISSLLILPLLLRLLPKSSREEEPSSQYRHFHNHHFRSSGHTLPLRSASLAFISPEPFTPVLWLLLSSFLRLGPSNSCPFFLVPFILFLAHIHTHSWVLSRCKSLSETEEVGGEEREPDWLILRPEELLPLYAVCFCPSKHAVDGRHDFSSWFSRSLCSLTFKSQETLFLSRERERQGEGRRRRRKERESVTRAEMRRVSSLFLSFSVRL